LKYGLCSFSWSGVEDNIFKNRIDKTNMKKSTKQIVLSLSLLFFYNFLCSQNIIDNCFTSASPVTNNDFISSSHLVNVYSADLLNWNGASWFGGFPGANITIPPPTNQIGCRAIFLGNGTTWTTGGEQVGLELSAPLVAGTTYTFNITYVSHGLGSNGSFAPSFYTSATPSLDSAILVGALTPVGYNWTTNSFSFTASSNQSGHTWIILKTLSNGSSGLINSFCQNCNITTSDCSVSVNSVSICEGSSATITATSTTAGNYSYQWSVPSGFENPGNVSSFTSNVAGNYSVVVTNLNTNCSASASGIITVNPLPIVVVNSETICEGSSATITATSTTAGNYSYQWSVPSGFENPGNVSSFTSNVAGNYSAVVTNLNTNCSSNIISGTLDIFPDFDFTIEQYCDQGSFIMEIVPVNSSFSISNSTIVWQLDNTITIGNNYQVNLTSYLNFTPVVEELPLNISVVITANNGCSKTSSLSIEQTYCGIQKGISINNDGMNDFFDLTLLGVKKLEIFNRYGIKVFQKNDYTNEWIGQSDKGEKLPDGTYYYLIEFKNNSIPKSGWIYLIREAN
jgi:gliding motility-associated-like protein